MTSSTRSAVRKGSAEDAHTRALDAMIARLPKTGALVLVHSHAELPALRLRVLRARGELVAMATRVLVAPTAADERRAVGPDPSLPVIQAPFLAEQRAYAAALAQVWSA